MLLNPVFTFFFDLLGWKVVGEVPVETKKGIFAGAPHNTWKDFFLSMGFRAKIKQDVGFLAKAELFKPPFGFIFHALGGTPVIRNSNMNTVENSADSIIRSKNKLFAITPEGTRNNVQKLRTGFYQIALKANVPIIRVGFDYPRKTVFIGEPFYPTGDFKKDMLTYFVPFFKNIQGKTKDWVKNYENGNFDAEDLTKN